MNPLITLIKNKITGGSGSGSLIEKLAGVANTFIKTPEERDAYDKAILEITNKHELDLEAVITERMKIEVDAAKADHLNTADSRLMNQKIQDSEKAGWLSKNVAYILDILVSIVWCGMTVFLIAKALKLAGEGADLTAVLSIYATVTAIFATVLNYHRGSTAGSGRKDKTIQDMSKKNS